MGLINNFLTTEPEIQEEEELDPESKRFEVRCLNSLLALLKSHIYLFVVVKIYILK